MAKTKLPAAFRKTANDIPAGKMPKPPAKMAKGMLKKMKK